MMKFPYQFICVTIISCVFGIAVADKKPVSKSTAICDELYRTGQYETALNCYQKALADGAGNPTIYLKLCMVLEALGQIEKIQQYLSKIDTTSAEARGFLEMLKTEYGTLNIRCQGQAQCPVYFVARPSLNFIAPAELESGRAKRLSIINEKYSKRSEIWFRKTNQEEYMAAIDYFPVISGVPLPFIAQIGDSLFEFNFNFMERSDFIISYGSLDSVYCGIPDSIAEVRISIDDPDFEAMISNSEAENGHAVFLDGRYYFRQGDRPVIKIQKNDRSLGNRKYFIFSSLALTTAFILLLR